MKKKLGAILIALVLVVALAIPMAGVVAAHSLSEPFTTDLIADGGWTGLQIDVGEVQVWQNPTDHPSILYVKYVIDDPDWVLTGIHLQVAIDVADIPQTKKGNPIPGHFEFSDTFYPGVTASGVYQVVNEVDLTWSEGNPLYIAAHCKVVNIHEDNLSTMLVCSDGNESYMAWSGPGDGTYTPIYPSSLRTGTAVPAWQHSAWQSSVNPSFTCGTWIWESYRVNEYVVGDIVDFYESFNIDGYPTGGTLKITADNGYEAYLNNNFIGSDGLSGDWRNSELKESNVTTAMSAWSSIETYNLTDLVPGSNSFRFETANEFMAPTDGGQGTGTIDSNPGGLIYEAELSYAEWDETAWGEGTRFNPHKRSWAMHFEYTDQRPVVSDEGEDLLGGQGEGAIRYKSFGNTGSREMYVGVPSLGVGANRVETDYTWSSPGTHAVKFAYDKDNSKLTAEVDGTTLEWTGITITADSYGDSVMLIKMAHRHASTTVEFNNVELNGWSLGDFPGGGIAWQWWSVTGFDFTESWELTGEIVLSGTFSSTSGDELSKVEISVGPHT